MSNFNRKFMRKQGYQASRCSSCGSRRTRVVVHEVEGKQKKYMHCDGCGHERQLKS